MDEVVFIRKLDSMERYRLKGLAISVFTDPKTNIRDEPKKENKEFRQALYELLHRDAISIKSFLSKHNLNEKIINDFIEIKKGYDSPSISRRKSCMSVNAWIRKNSKKQFRAILNFILRNTLLYYDYSDFQDIQQQIYETYNFKIKKVDFEIIRELFTEMVFSEFLYEAVSINKVLLDFRDSGLSKEALAVIGDIMEDREEVMKKKLYDEIICVNKQKIKLLPFKIKQLSEQIQKIEDLNYFI